MYSLQVGAKDLLGKKKSILCKITHSTISYYLSPKFELKVSFKMPIPSPQKIFHLKIKNKIILYIISIATVH